MLETFCSRSFLLLSLSLLQVSEGGGAAAEVAGGGSEGRRLAARDLPPLLETLRAVLLHGQRGGSADSLSGRHAHQPPCDGAGGHGDATQTTNRQHKQAQSGGLSTAHC